MRKILQSSLLLLVVLVCVPAMSQAAGEASYSGSTERSVLALLNDIRHEHGLPAFVASNALRGAAREHSSDMLSRGYFEHDSSKLTADSSVTLDAVAASLLASPEVKVEIAGHTDATGSDA